MQTEPMCGTILIVDDMVENLRLLSQILAEHGCDIRAAKTGREALDSIHAELPDVVILDVRLPDISGYDVCAALKADPKTSAIPVIFLSALDETTAKLRGFEAGGADYMTKPFVSEEVLVRVRTHLDTSRLRAQLEHNSRELQLNNERLQVEIAERKLASEKLIRSITQLEDSKIAALNLLEDLKTEMEQRKRIESQKEDAIELLRQTSGYLNSLIDHANAPIITWDPHYNITRFNHAFENITDYAVNDVMGKELQMLFPQESRNESLRKIALTSSGEQWESVEIPIQQKGGEIRMALWNSANILDAEGKKIIATIAQGQDITERKKAEQEFIRLNAELEAKVGERTKELRDSQLALLNLVDDMNRTSRNLATANDTLAAVNKELAAFSYSVSHDLRAPLRSIDGFSSALLEDYGDKLNDEAKNYFDRIRRATQTMGQLIDDMLNLSRVTQSEFYRQDFNLSAMVRDIVNAEQQKNPLESLVVDIQDDVIVCADQRLINIAMTNLLDNAWKFTGKSGHPHIEFGAAVQNGETAIFVRDNGVGFDMTYAGKIFDAFQRLHRTEEFPGTGIGLATVQRIINRHGGRIWAESEPGKGATFYFTLGV